jgi:hypothetical protein
VAGTHDRREPRRAQPVHRHAAYRLRQPGEQYGHPRNVAIVLPSLVRAAEPDVLDLFLRHPCPVDRAPHYMSRQIVRPRT